MAKILAYLSSRHDDSLRRNQSKASTILLSKYKGRCDAALKTDRLIYCVW
jgi:hypothetical protein